MTWAKIGVPGFILDKPGKLTDEEWAIIKEHPGKGALILEPIPAFRDVVPLVAQHHERFDGGGYPLNLAGPTYHWGRESWRWPMSTTHSSQTGPTGQVGA